MQKLITITFCNEHGDDIMGDAVVDFACFEEDNKMVEEVTAIALPENAPKYFRERMTLRDRITTAFHKGEGYNL